MISRREFFVGAGATITLGTLDKFENYLARNGEPLIEVPRRVGETLYVDPEAEWQIGLNGAPGFSDCPYKTMMDYIRANWDTPEPKSPEEFSQIYQDHGVRAEELYEPVPWETWCQYLDEHDGPDDDAFYRLQGLDLEERAEIDGVLVGGLTFENGLNLSSGGWFRGVHADGGLSVSLLQHRLNRLGEGIKVKLVG